MKTFSSTLTEGRWFAYNFIERSFSEEGLFPMEPKMTKRQEQAQVSRQRLLSAAQGMFARNGYAETSIHALCKSLGMASSLLYHYFPGGKKELLETLVTREVRVLFGELSAPQIDWDAMPLEDVLENLFLQINATVMRHPDVFRLFFQEQEVRELAVYNRLRGFLDRRMAWFLALLKGRAGRGEIRSMDFESAVQSLEAVILYHLTMELTGFNQSNLAQGPYRRRLIAYQVSLWKVAQADEK